MRYCADALRPGKSPITTTRPNTTSRNANASKNNTTTSNQCAYYHQSYIEEVLNDIHKRLYQRSQPSARTARHSRWEKEMQLRREQKEEQATETQITIYETEQQQEQKIKDDKKRKEITKPNHTAEWIREWLTLITQLDGTGGHEQLSKRA
jgi:hypothetical protein